MAFHKESSDGGTPAPWAAEEHPRLPEAAQDAVTRAMCFAVHLNREFRDQVGEHTLPTGRKAGCPSAGVDMVAVWRHSRLARDRWQSAALCLNTLQVVLGLSLAVTVFAASAPLYLSAQWLWTGAAAIVASAAAIRHGRAIVHATVRDTVETATRLRQTDVPPLPCVTEQSEKDSEDERRIEEIEDADMIVFSSRSATPFIGSGIPVEAVVMQPVDIHRGAGDQNVEPLPFDAHHVHDYLMDHLPSRGLDSVAPRQRLFIRGDAIAATARSPWEDREKPPPSKVSPEWVKEGVDRPTGRARTYVCLERRLNGGRLVVSMFVRVAREGNMLSLEIATYVLPGLDPRRVRLDDPFRTYFDGNLDPLPGHTVDTACRRITGQLLTRYLTTGSWDAPPKADENERDDDTAQETEAGSDEQARSAEVRKKETEEIERSAALGERAYDFGAETSLREWAAHPYMADYFEILDTRDCLQRMQRSVIDCLDDFLTERHVDTSEFRVRRDQIINNTTYEIQHVEGSGHHIGPQGKVIHGQSARSERARPAGRRADDSPGHTA
ncbi:hypothetical protein ACWHLZ_20800 [Streptomyces chartreusis]|uniref:hypothetical protein n=1 Tax=Streptomyces chartreusis TaxID=1969 RepID=UPI003868A62B|nr:hypothetical protein OIA45_10945 [Streptomyces chartreusis]